MLQKIDRLEWDCPCESCRDKSPDSQHWSGEYDGQGINIVDADDSEAWYHIDLPPGVVLAQEVAQGDRTMDNTDDMPPQEQAAIQYEVAHMNCDDIPPINGVPARLLFDLVDVAGYAVTFAGEVAAPYDPNAFDYLFGVAQATENSGREWLENYMAQEGEAPASAPADPFMPSPEVRAALRTVFYVNSQASYAEYGTALEVAEKWVRSWPQ